MSFTSSFIILIILVGFGTNCLMAPVTGEEAAAGHTRLFELASVFTYNYESTLLFNEVDPGGGKDVGFQITAKLTVETVWQSSLSPQTKLLLLKLVNPRMAIKSRKAPAPEGFISHTSKLEESKNGPFLLHWNEGRVKSVYISQNEAVSLINLKKGIASFFQFQFDGQEIKETDASGHCTVTYTNVDRNMIEKIKTDCQQDSRLPFIKHADKFWRAAVSSKRRSIIVLSTDLTAVENIESEEKHKLFIPLREEAGSIVSSKQHIKLQEKSTGTLLIQENTMDIAVSSLEKSTGYSFAEHPLFLTKENNICIDGTCPSFNTMVKENRQALQTENFGTIQSASAFIKLINYAREAKKDSLVEIMKNSKNKNILFQLMDLMGSAQTVESHKAALTILNFQSEDSIDLIERYLWSLSFGSHPDEDIIRDLVSVMESGPYNEKVDETIILTIAAMTNKLKNHNITEKTVRDVLLLITNKLKGCSPSDDYCLLKYIRALKNLAHVESIPILLIYANNGSKRVSVAAVNAIYSFSKNNWPPEVIQIAKKMFFQLDKRYDSSARTIALDILLENGPEESLLSDLLKFLKNTDPDHEVKQYLMQRLKQKCDSDGNLMLTVKSIMKSLNIFNYNVLSQKGLSTSFTRLFMRNPSSNGTLSTVQEMSGGIVKRGLVDVIINKEGSSQSIFTLGLFAGGLGSFLSSDDVNGEDDEEETAIAGMDLTVMGVQIRPFVFFNGQAELMGHVWTGTASDKTPAFQALGLLVDHLQFIPLEAGFLAELNIQGGVSFDLSGQVSLSIWNRNAESLVEKSAGLSVMGLVRVNTMFVHSQVQFNIATEVKLRLISNIDFYNNIVLCLQLQQPDSVIKHNIHKVERIPGSKHRLRKSKYKVIPVSGKTYALNKKNNDLCNLIFYD